MAAMVMRMPTANRVEIQNARPCRDPALLADEADDERNAGQVAGAENDAQDAPDDDAARR